MAGRSFHLTVVTPEGPALDIEAVSAVFPAYDGEYGILPGHAPLLSLLGLGLLRATAAGGERHRLYIEGGFAQMVDDRLTLLTENALPPEEIDLEEAESQAAQWREMTVTDEAVEARDRAEERVRAMRRIARRAS